MPQQHRRSHETRALLPATWSLKLSFVSGPLEAGSTGGWLQALLGPLPSVLLSLSLVLQVWIWVHSGRFMSLKPGNYFELK